MEQYGGKADHLIRLKKADFLVPDFWMVRSDYKAEDLRELQNKLVGSSQTYAVRSSASIEDTVSSSMAGLFETFLNVPREELFEKIEACFLSAGSKRVNDFKLAKGITEPVKMTVIIQNMVEAEVSGVLFTANPQGITNEMMAVLGYGSGILVVEDKIAVTTLIHHFHDDLDLMIQEPTTPQLNEPLTRQLIELAQRLKAEFGRPMDAEFCLAQGKLWLLQARPITTLGASFETILDNSNISESYPGITSPLSIDFAKAAYGGVFHGLVAKILNEQTATIMGPVLQEMVTSSSGRMYYQINNWYKIMKLLPLSWVYIPIWQEMMGVEQKEVETARYFLNPLTRLLGIGRFLQEFRKTPHRMKELHVEFQQFQDYFYSVLKTDPDQAQLIELFATMKETLVDKWDVTLLNDLHAFIYTAALKKLVHHKVKRGRVKNSLKNMDWNRVISNIGELESLKPIRLLTRIAAMAPVDFLTLQEGSDIRAYLKKDEPFAEIINDYIHLYGDRYLEELKLESKTFRTNPELLLETIRSLRSGLVNKPAKSNEAKPVKPLADPTVDIHREFGKSVIYQGAVLGIRNREIARLDRTRIFGMARELFLRLGRIMVESGALEEPRDVFWLNLSEVLQAGPADHRAKIAQRARIYEEYKRLPMFTRLVFNGPAVDRILPGASGTMNFQTSRQASLIGTGASMGTVRGKVLIVEEPSDAVDAVDKILVTRQTDPGWVFLIANAKGLIAERGSLLSHTAIIARELGKPAVVGLKGAVTLFENGELVEVNGTTGQVRRLESNESN